MFKSFFSACLGFTLACNVPVAACATKLEQLKGLYNSLPTPLAYYPLMKEFSLRDGSGNGLDGSFSENHVDPVAGPFGKKDTAFETGANPVDRKYMIFSSPHFSFGASSWTMSVWVNPKDKVAPIFDYRFPGNYRYAHLWIHDTAGKLYAGTRNDQSVSIPCPSSTWQFVAWVYDSSMKTTKLFCDDAFGNAVVTDTSHIKTRPTFTLGFVGARWAGDYQFACLQVYRTDLSAAELLTIKSMCALYEEAIDCPIQKCQTDTCRPDLSAPNGYTCAACSLGWSGSGCQTPVCGNACQNGGTCVGPDVCACPAGWQGASCHTPICLRACADRMTCTAPGDCSPSTGGGRVIDITYGRATQVTSPIYISVAKCFWVIFGELSYGEAIKACRLRNGTLAELDSPSEEHAVRQRIDWNAVPGYRSGSTWVGQLWLGATRQQGNWQWNTGVSFTFASWFEDPAQTQGNQSCVVMQKTGWRPMHCRGSNNIDSSKAGAICQMVTRGDGDSDLSQRSHCGASGVHVSSSSDLALRAVMRKTFFLVNGNFSWDSAGRACLANNGTLAMLKSNTETEFALKNIDFSLVNNRTWIGLRRPSRGANSFVWIDDTENKNLTGFLLGQPNNNLGGNQDCVAFVMTDARETGWSDFACNPYGTPKAGSSPISALCESFRYL